MNWKWEVLRERRAAKKLMHHPGDSQPGLSWDGVSGNGKQGWIYAREGEEDLKVTPCLSKSEVEPSSSNNTKGNSRREGVCFPYNESEVWEAYLSGGVQHL